MITIETVRKIALSFEGAVELPHGDKTSFRVKKRIFATLNVKENRACIKLSPIDQHVFSSFDKNVIYPVPNKFGTQGWTLRSLQNMHEEMFTDAITCAFQFVTTRFGVRMKG